MPYVNSNNQPLSSTCPAHTTFHVLASFHDFEFRQRLNIYETLCKKTLCLAKKGIVILIIII